MTHPDTTRHSQPRPAGREPAWPIRVLLVGVVSFTLLVATVVGYQVAAGGAEPGSAARGAVANAPIGDDRGGGETVPQAPEVTPAPPAASSEPSPEPADPPSETSPEPADPPSEPSPEPTDPPAEEDEEAPARGDLPPVQAPAGTGMLHVPPVAIDIPAIEVSSSLVDLGLNPDRTLQVPQDYSKAGWFTEGAYPGDTSAPPALIVGHVDDANGPAVFYRLKELEVGDTINVQRSDGSTAVFVVYHAQQYAKNELPTEEIYSKRKDSELVLITCTGDFDSAAGSYLDNYVVTARLDPAQSSVGA